VDLPQYDQRVIWTVLGSIAGVVSAVVALVSLVLLVRRRDQSSREHPAPEPIDGSQPDSLVQTEGVSDGTPDDLTQWAEWAWDHGSPHDQLRARKLMGYGELDPEWGFDPEVSSEDDKTSRSA
jgi:hypothetical protein